MQKKISIIIPFFNESEILEKLYYQINESVKKLNIDYEIICIDDGSSDQTFKKLVDINKKNNNWKIFSLSRNFGHQAAIATGLQVSTGDFIAVMDADLQDPPEFLSSMLEKLLEGYDVVYCVRKSRKGNIIKRLCYKTFYILLSKISSIHIPMDAGDFCLMNRKVVNILNKLKEKSRYVRGLRSWVGFSQASYDYDRAARIGGKPKYTYLKLINLALDGITNFSSLPLRLATFLGFALAFTSLIFATVIVFLKLLSSSYFIEGATLTRVLILFLGSIQLIAIGIIGEYIGKIFLEVKSRPISIIKDFKGISKEEIVKLNKNNIFDIG